MLSAQGQFSLEEIGGIRAAASAWELLYYCFMKILLKF